MKRLLICLALMAVSACTSSADVAGNMPRGAAAYAVIPSNPTAAAISDYHIGPLDSVDVTVFQEPELSVKAVQVDASGRIALPLVGTVDASGKTASELSRELEQKFGEKYLNNPQVTVVVAGSVSQKIAVQGEVTEPGVYDIKGPTTLLEVLSLAKGETNVASLKEVVVFRNINGKRMGAVFDVGSIRRGESNDPQVQGNDLVVVGYSAARRFWRDVMTGVPLLNVFRVVPL
jgi:polysaccharide export outer membrane protein